MNGAHSKAWPAGRLPGAEIAPVAASIPGRLMGLQQLRFWAALLVLLHHTLEECSANASLTVPKGLVLFGASGVDIFFVVSGFVIWRTTLGLSSRQSAGAFTKRRLLRVLPLYWICLIFILLLWMSTMAFRSLSVTPSTLMSSFFLLPPSGDGGLLIGAAWTLVYEIYFYALCAMALCFGRERLRPLLLVCMLALLPRVLVNLGAVTIGSYYGNPIVMEFVLGCLLGMLATRIAYLRWRYRAAAAGITGLVLASCFLESQGTAGLVAEVRWWGWGIPAALLVWACVAGLQVPRAAGARWLNTLGDASYALYLTHGLVMIALARLLKSGVASQLWATLALGAAAVVFAILLSYFFHLRIEVPLTRWLDRRFAESPAGARAKHARRP
jgi:exopolysaccharide production protein ExoZ